MRQNVHKPQTSKQPAVAASLTFGATPTGLDLHDLSEDDLPLSLKEAVLVINRWLCLTEPPGPWTGGKTIQIRCRLEQAAGDRHLTYPDRLGLADWIVRALGWSQQNVGVYPEPYQRAGVFVECLTHRSDDRRESVQAAKAQTERTDIVVPRSDALASIDLFAGAVMPKASVIEREELRGIITQAQASDIPDPDKDAFVERVNEVLTALRCAIRLPDGRLARLKVAPGRKGKVLIQFKIIGVGNAGGFRETAIAVVPVRRVAHGKIVEAFGESESS